MPVNKFKIKLQADYFEIEPTNERFYYNDLQKVELIKGKMNWLVTIFSWIGGLFFDIGLTGEHRENNEMRITFKNDQKESRYFENKINDEMIQSLNSISKILR